MLSIIEMYLWGVSTRNVEEIMEPLCGFTISKSHVSDLASHLDQDLKLWRERPLTDCYEYLVFDARYEKVREGGRVASKAFVVGVGITTAGKREILGCWITNSESYESWDACIKELKVRGLKGVKYIVSDDNQGLRSALAKHFQGVLWQRFQVHFMRNFLSKLSKSDQFEGMRLLKDIFAADSKEETRTRLYKIEHFLKAKKKDLIWKWLEENIEESLKVLELPVSHQKK